MIFRPGRKFTATTSIHHRNFVVSLAVLIAEMIVTTMMSRGGGSSSSSTTCKLHFCPLIATTWAWIPHRLRNDHHSISRYIPRGCNDLDFDRRSPNVKSIYSASIHGYSSMRSAPSHRYSSSSNSRSSTTSIQRGERNNPNDIVTEARNMAMSICGDDLSFRACSIFGGLKYFNTVIDNRFRVLFVLGGPGKNIRYGYLHDLWHIPRILT